MITTLYFSPDGKRILSGGASEFSGRVPAQVRLWNVGSATVERSGASANSVGSVAFSPDSAKVAFSDRAAINIWPVAAAGNH